MNRRNLFAKLAGLCGALVAGPAVVKAEPSNVIRDVTVRLRVRNSFTAGPGLDASGSCQLEIDTEYFRKRLKGKYDQRLIDELIAVIERGEA